MVIGNNITSENLIIVKELINNWQIASTSKKKIEKYESTRPNPQPDSTRNPIDPFWPVTRFDQRPDWLDLPVLPCLSRTKTFVCYSCGWRCNGFVYTCETCIFELDVQCSLTLDILTHEGHEHQLILSSTANLQSCTACGGRGNHVFRCTTCEFALDFKCVTLPLSTMYKEHEHPFTLCYSAKDDSGEYYCDICERERDQNHWFYYCEECSYPVHFECIFRRSPNFK